MVHLNSLNIRKEIWRRSLRNLCRYGLFISLQNFKRCLLQFLHGSCGNIVTHITGPRRKSFLTKEAMLCKFKLLSVMVLEMSQGMCTPKKKKTGVFLRKVYHCIFRWLSSVQVLFLFPCCFYKVYLHGLYKKRFAVN